MPAVVVEERDLVVVGKIVGIFGVRGWVKVFSHTSPKEGILGYTPWQIKVSGQWRAVKVVSHQRHGKSLLAHLEGFDDRDESRSLIGCEVAIERSQLPPAQPGEYYWADLIGLSVVTTQGVELGRVDHLLQTGANDVLVVAGDRERLIPFVQGVYVIKVDLDSKLIHVDWDPEF